MPGFFKRRAVPISGAVVLLLLACAATTFAQDLGDIARQERERRKDQPQRETHVYTNDDLEKPHILVPEDQARALSARTWIEPTATQTAQADDLPVSIPPGAIRVPPSPATAKSASIASSQARVEMPVTARPVGESATQPQPQQSVRTVTRGVSLPVLVSSPTGWKTVRLGRASSALSVSDVVTRKPVSTLARQPEANSSESNRPQPQPSMRAAIRKVSQPVLVSSSRGWRAVRLETPSSALPLSDVATGNPVAALAAQPEASSSESNRVRVGRGDSLWKLAERHLGDGALWRVLARLNPQLSNPDLIRVGDWIYLSSRGSRDAKHIVVRSGDTLWSVAHAEFGNGLAFGCIASANPQLQSVDRIRPGETLTLPDTCALAR